MNAMYLNISYFVYIKNSSCILSTLFSYISVLCSFFKSLVHQSVFFHCDMHWHTKPATFFKNINKIVNVWFVAFMATLYNEKFSGYQPCQIVKWRKYQRFKDHLCPRLQGTNVSGESVCVRYRPAQVPRSWQCASQWELLACVESMLLQASFLIG
jgi:hypothetical protein